MEKTFKQQPSDCLKIVLFGPESTGKTTLAKQLASYFRTTWVPEYMRAYLQKKWDESSQKVCREDLLPIAKGQMDSENEAAQNASNFLFCDTNLLQLQVYSEYYYNGYCPKALKQGAKNAQYELYLLTDIDVNWVQDDLRDRPDDRLTLFRIFEAELKKRNHPYHKISGGERHRLEQAIALTEKLGRN